MKINLILFRGIKNDFDIKAIKNYHKQIKINYIISITYYLVKKQLILLSYEIPYIR